MKALLAFLLLVGFVALYWQWILAAVVVVLIIRAAPIAWREYQAERAAQRARRDELVARADQQHRWACEGDPRGTFGEWTPVV